MFLNEEAPGEGGLVDHGRGHVLGAPNGSEEVIAMQSRHSLRREYINRHYFRHEGGNNNIAKYSKGHRRLWSRDVLEKFQWYECYSFLLPSLSFPELSSFFFNLGDD